MPTESKAKKRQTRKPLEREAYAAWLATPLSIRRLPADHKDRVEYIGDDPLLQELASCRFKKDVAALLKVSPVTLVEWDNDPELQKMVEKMGTRNNALRYAQDIDLAFARKTAKTADHNRVRLYKEVYQGWRPGVDVTSNGLPFQLVITPKAVRDPEKPGAAS